MYYDILDERHWFGRRGWPVLRGQIIRLARAEWSPLLSCDRSQATAFAREFDAFVERLSRAMLQRAEERYSSMWSYGVSLLGDAALLRSMMESDPVLAPNSPQSEKLESAMTVTLRRYLERARRRAQPSTEHRHDVWEMIDRVSREIAREYEAEGKVADRSSLGHVRAVAARCREKYPTNKNLPKEFDTWVGFFEEFSEHFHATLETGDPDLDIAAAEDLVRSSRIQPAIGVCLDRLHRASIEGYEAFLIFADMHPTFHGSVSGFAEAKGLSRHQMSKRVSGALEALRKCIESSVNLLLGSAR